MPQTPPVPPITFRVGVSGHRPNRLDRSDPPLLARQIERVLETIRREVAQAASASSEATLRVLSSLAEGADRLVAAAALDLGYALQVPLPFPREDYETDFGTAESKQEFRGLLARANAVFEMDAPAGERARGYRAAGEIVLDQCDVLLVIWDGQPGAGIGGTPELIERAGRLGHPVIRIDAVAPHPISLLPLSKQPLDSLAAIAALVRSLLVLPINAQPFAGEYRNEGWPHRNASTSYTFVRLFSHGRLRSAPRPQLSDPVPEIGLPLLKPYFQWADALAIHYGESSRSAALRLQLLAVASVISGVLSIPFEEHVAVVRVLSGMELGTTVLLVLAALVVSRRPWHKRWLLYRSLAEQLRSLDFIAPLGQTLAQPTATGFYSDADGSALFGAYHLTGIIRHLGLPGARVDSTFLADRRTALTATIHGQADFQTSASERYEALGKNLHRLGLALFSGAVVLSLYDVAKAFGITGFSSPWTVTASALLPALGSAFASIAAQGEYERLANRAHSMSRCLNDLLTRLQGDEPLSLSSLGASARVAADVLTSEVRDWQILVSVKKPSLPV